MRREAVRCLGLYCFLDGIPTARASHLAVLRQVVLTPGEASAVKAVAVQVRRLRAWAALPLRWSVWWMRSFALPTGCWAALSQRIVWAD